MRLRTKILLAILLTLLAGDVLGTFVVQNRLADGAQREANNQAVARAQQVRSLYQERSATLVAEGEAISLYPAVIAALLGNNPGPLRTWSSQVANLQGTSVTVTDASGHVVSRGHAPDLSGDDLSGNSRACARRWRVRRSAASSLATSLVQRCAAMCLCARTA